MNVIHEKIYPSYRIDINILPDNVRQAWYNMFKNIDSPTSIFNSILTITVYKDKEPTEDEKTIIDFCIQRNLQFGTMSNGSYFINLEFGQSIHHETLFTDDVVINVSGKLYDVQNFLVDNDLIKTSIAWEL